MASRKGGREIKKAQYYVWYLGWKECRGVFGREFTEPIARELIHKRKHEDLPKLTIEVSSWFENVNNLEISGNIEGPKLQNVFQRKQKHFSTNTLKEPHKYRPTEIIEETKCGNSFIFLW